MSEPLYRTIDFLTDPSTVFERLESGWDWLGVDAEGEFVVGYPSRLRPAMKPPDVTIIQPGAREGEHGVRVESPGGRVSRRWYASRAEASEQFVRAVDALRRRPEGQRSLALVQRIEHGSVVDETFVRT